MRQETFMELLGDLPGDMIVSAVRARYKRSPAFWIPAIAACLAVTVAAAAYPKLRIQEPETESTMTETTQTEAVLTQPFVIAPGEITVQTVTTAAMPESVATTLTTQSVSQVTTVSRTTPAQTAASTADTMTAATQNAPETINTSPETTASRATTATTAPETTGLETTAPSVTTATTTLETTGLKTTASRATTGTTTTETTATSGNTPVSVIHVPVWCTAAEQQERAAGEVLGISYDVFPADASPEERAGYGIPAELDLSSYFCLRVSVRTTYADAAITGGDLTENGFRLRFAFLGKQGSYRTEKMFVLAFPAEYAFSPEDCTAGFLTVYDEAFMPGQHDLDVTVYLP